MKRLYIRIHNSRLHFIWGLALLISACGNKTSRQEVAIHWEGNKATGIVVPQNMLAGYSKDSVESWLQLRLAHSSTAILGEYMPRGDSVVFMPLIPFSRGFEYNLYWRDSLVDYIKIPDDSTIEKPDVIAVYPSGDVLPENLLKMYIVFNKPMAEGQAMDNIEVLKNKKTIVPSAFLDLEPELWNSDRTMLTVWLDPGRIKRDLQPNKKLGPPLEAGNRYVIRINQGWEDADGLLLRASWHMEFETTLRDEHSPDPEIWDIVTPVARTQYPLTILVHEPLDYGVLMNAIRILDFKGKPVSTTLATRDGETVLEFTPARPWTPGYYSLEVEPRLEDLAGNNLERLFDKDLLNDTAIKRTGGYKKVFRIQ